MARYQLIKEYPGSLDKGTIVYSGHKEQSYSDYKYKVKNEKNVRSYIFFDADYIEKFPKHWKKLS